jgi:hypothetical protein
VAHAVVIVELERHAGRQLRLAPPVDRAPHVARAGPLPRGARLDDAKRRPLGIGVEKEHG